MLLRQQVKHKLTYSDGVVRSNEEPAAYQWFTMDFNDSTACVEMDTLQALHRLGERGP